MGMIFILIIGLVIGVFIYRFFAGQSFIKKPDLKGRYFNQSIYVQGIKRKFSCFIPNSINEDIALIFMLHGAKDTGNIFRKRLSYRWDKLAEKEGFVVVYPSGFKRSWNDCRKNASYPARKKSIDDFRLLVAIRNQLITELGVSNADAYLFGYSNGGQLVNKICMEHPGWSVGAFSGCANIPTPENLSICQGKGFQPMVILQGSNDKINPFYGGKVELFKLKKLGMVRSVVDTVRFWKQQLEFEDDPKVEIFPHAHLNDRTRIEKRTYKKDKHEVFFQFIVHNGGHTLPDFEINFPRILGKTNHDINLAEEVWRCFQLFKQ